MKIGDAINSFTLVGIEGSRGGKFRVRCICGNEKVVKRSLVINGLEKSCGCYKAKSAKARFTKHGEVQHINGKRTASPEYRTWQNMRNRCANPNSQDYRYYGGRGVNIDAEWGDFNNFLRDMGRRPSPSHTLERINSNEGYNKNNCCWATRKAQARNRAYAKTKAWELAEQLGVKDTTAHHYIWRVRTKDKGGALNFKHYLSSELEAKVREFIKEKGI